MDAYAFQAALFCADCGEALVRDLRRRGVEDTGDSNDFPQGPFAEGGARPIRPSIATTAPDAWAPNSSVDTELVPSSAIL